MTSGWRAIGLFLYASQDWPPTQENGGVIHGHGAGIGTLTYDWLIVGAGFAGSVLAERLASQSNAKVLIIDRRPHIAGNAFDRLNEAGILIHQYGPHIFHTNAWRIVEYLSQFTTWRFYEHRVLAQVSDMLLPIPINLDTVNRLYGLSLDSKGLQDWFRAQSEPVGTIRTAEDVVVAAVGRDLYDKFFKGYTLKQWGVDPSALDPQVTLRLKARLDRDDRYFNDEFQAIPTEGYTEMFRRMLDNPNITILTSIDFRDLPRDIEYEDLIYTGRIDEFYNFCYGRLPYRSIQFDHVTKMYQWHQPAAVVNYPQTQDYTRITEHKHLTGQLHPFTALTYEYPTSIGEPYYPLPQPEHRALFKRYEQLARADKKVRFVGRLATYQYYNMDQVIGQSLATFRRIIKHE